MRTVSNADANILWLVSLLDRKPSGLISLMMRLTQRGSMCIVMIRILQLGNFCRSNVAISIPVSIWYSGAGGRLAVCAGSSRLTALFTAWCQDPSLAGGLNNYLFIDRTYQWDAKLEEAIKALTPAQVNAAFKKYIDPAKINYVKAGEFEKPANSKAF